MVVVFVERVFVCALSNEPNSPLMSHLCGLSLRGRLAGDKWNGSRHNNGGANGPEYMKGGGMGFRQSIILNVNLLAISMGLFCGAEAKTIEKGPSAAGWNGKVEVEWLFGGVGR